MAMTTRATAIRATIHNQAEELTSAPATVEVPKTPPRRPPRAMSPYRRFAAAGVTLSLRNAKNVTTIRVL